MFPGVTSQVCRGGYPGITIQSLHICTHADHKTFLSGISSFTRSPESSLEARAHHPKPRVITRSLGSSLEVLAHHSKPGLITRSPGSSDEARAHQLKPGLISRSPGSSLEAWAHHSKPGLILALWKSWAISLMELTIPITSFICNCFNC